MHFDPLFHPQPPTFEVLVFSIVFSSPVFNPESIRFEDVLPRFKGYMGGGSG